jgi:hypothetical protein
MEDVRVGQITERKMSASIKVKEAWQVTARDGNEADGGTVADWLRLCFLGTTQSMGWMLPIQTNGRRSNCSKNWCYLRMQHHRNEVESLNSAVFSMGS